MLNPSLPERNALGGRAFAGGSDRLSVTIAPESARFSLRVDPAAHEAAGACFGGALPARIGGVAAAGDRLALRLGPDEWMLLAAPADRDLIETRFASGLSEAHSLVDVSHREVGVVVRGSAAELALRAACALDLSAIPAPFATRTLFDKAPVVLIKLAPDDYRIEVWPSFATHVWGLLDAAGREIAFDL